MLKLRLEVTNFIAGLTWIIIVLIILSIFVTCSEVFLRFGILSTRGAKAKALPMCIMPDHGGLR